MCDDKPAVNDANEYTVLDRAIGGTPVSLAAPVHDRAGNMTTFSLRPAKGNSAGVTVDATSVAWDAFNRLKRVKPGLNSNSHYVYDALGRRIASFEADGDDDDTGTDITPTDEGRRFIWDGWNCVVERLFVSSATLGDAESELERVHVEGASIDEHVLTAIDGDADGLLTTNYNRTRGDLNSGDADYEYFYLTNRMGHTVALLDASNGNRVLEYVRYTVYGEATFLPVLDDGVNGGTASDGYEDTPETLTDNDADASAASKLASAFRNRHTFTDRYLDERTGLLYYRYRYYEPRMGRFVGKDIARSPWSSVYVYARNRVTFYGDSYGLYSFDVDEDKCTVTLNFYMQFYFESGNEGDWKDQQEKMDWAMKASTAIETAWSDKYKIQGAKTYEDTEYGLAFTSWGCPYVASWTVTKPCPCPDGYVCKVWITIGVEGATLFDDNEMTVYKDSAASRRPFVNGSNSEVGIHDAELLNTPGGNQQVRAAHEFGHMIGLHHPSHGVAGVDPNSAEEYNDPPGHPNAGNPSKSIMGAGMDILPEHMEQWRQAVEDDADDECGPYSIVKN